MQQMKKNTMFEIEDENIKSLKELPTKLYNILNPVRKFNAGVLKNVGHNRE